MPPLQPFYYLSRLLHHNYFSAAAAPTLLHLLSSATLVLVTATTLVQVINPSKTHLSNSEYLVRIKETPVHGFVCFRQEAELEEPLTDLPPNPLVLQVDELEFLGLMIGSF